MKCLQCLVILSAWTCLSVSVGIRVPSAWDEVQGRDGVRNFDGRIDPNYGLNNGQQRYNPGHLERRIFVDNNQQANAELGTLYGTLQSSALNSFFGRPHQMLFLNQNGIQTLPQSNQGNAAISSETNQRKTQLPPLRHPRYPANPQLSINNVQYERTPVKIGGGQYQNSQQLPLGSIRIEPYNNNYQNVPSNVLRITPISLGNINLNNYKPVEQSQLGQPTLKQFSQNYKPSIKEYARNPSAGYGSQLEVPAQSLKGHVAQDHTFIVSASTLSPVESDPNQGDPSVEFSINKEPIVFVTEGYRNVLLQGSNKKKKYQKPQYQNQEASRKVLKTEKLQRNDETEEDDDEDETPPRRRKVTKVYKIHGNNVDQGSGAGGSRRNLVESELQKRRYLKRPEINTEDDRRLGSRNRLTKNHRDDKIHEPSDDNDSEREDDDPERIEDDENNDENELETEEEEENETEDADDSDDRDSPEPETNGKDTVESDESEETDEEDAESVEEEEREQEVPHSEHADPKPVQTVPNYPGEGVWAKQGVKHRPYVTQHRFIKPQEVEQKPDGYDVFEDLAKYFENQKDQFGRTFGAKIDQSGNPVANTLIKPPNSVTPIVVYDPFNESSVRKSVHQLPSETTITNEQRLDSDKPENTAEEQPEDNDEHETENQDTEGTKEENFVPVQLYSQVRKSDSEQHEEHDPLEHGRLREVIKDSKVQTVYSEEGYADAAYDHAGHEKKAEQDQGHEQFEREKLEKLKPKEQETVDSYAGQSNKVLISDDVVEDSLPSDSIYPSLLTENIAENQETQQPSRKKLKSSNNNNFITTQELKTTQVKDKENGDVQLEIQSEVKVIVQPNNSTKAHKYVKIYPKVLREYSKEISEENSLEKISNDNGKETDQESDKTVPTTEIIKKSSDIKGDRSDNSFTQSNGSTSTETSFTVKVTAFDNEFGNIASSEKPKVTVKVFDDEEALANIRDKFGEIGQVERKRRSIDSENKDLEIDIGFIDQIDHTFAEKQPDEVNIEKYPYYTMPDLNENSPLRYAENMDNIPVKKDGELSFYKMADKYECPDVPQNIDPIPEHVKVAEKNAEENESDEDDEENEEVDEESDEDEIEDEGGVDQNLPKEPRIKLGDKIDCLKIRYFGENPLDSPFFKEETVGPVKSIFKELDRKSATLKIDKNVDNAQKTSQIVENINKVNEIFNQKDKSDERIFESEVKDKVYNALKKTENIDNKNGKGNATSSIENAESINTNIRVIKPKESESLNWNPTPAPLVTLITTPKYTIQLTPKNIYDQIRLLDHLPEEDVTEIIETSTKDIGPTKVKVMEKRIYNEITTEAAKSASPKTADQADRENESSKRQPKTLREENSNEEGRTQVTPDAEALRRRRLRPRKPVYQIFDVNKFLTTTPYSIINPVHNTVLPKHKVISEVFYKDEIKPNEQLNVFADVLNNIKNSTNLETVPLQSASNFAEPDSVTISNLDEANIVQASPKIRVKKYQKDGSHNQNFINRIPSRNVVTTEKHYNPRYPESYEEHLIIPHTSTDKNIVMLDNQNPDKFGYIDKNIRSTPKNFYSGEDNNQYSSRPNINVGTKKNLRRRRKPTKGTSTTSTSTTFRTTTNINVPDQSSPRNHKPYVIDVLEDTTQVVGLVPPSLTPSKGYRTIVEDSDSGDTNEVPNKVYEYKTIPPNFVTEPLAGPAAVTELIDEDTPPIRNLNKYYFLGLKPPLNQRARSYTEFMGANKNVGSGNKNENSRRRMFNDGYSHIGHMRFRRAAARASYSEVSRNRGSQNEGIHKDTTPYDDIDDYVPHRPKNYHYDEKTGKIVYHDKHQVVEKDIEDEEEEYEEIPETPGRYLETAEDATHPTPKKATTKPLLATATPPPDGKGLLDFVAKLKNNPSYVVIPDPTTPDPSSISSTQQFVTVDPKSTNPPEFLSILSKVKSDSSYKAIEDPKESKLKSKSTTPTPEYEDEEEEEEQEEEGSIPHQRFVRQTDLQIFNIGDFLPKIQSPISSPIPQTPTNFIKKQIVDKFFPKLRYMTPLDIAREKIRERFQNNTVYQFIQKNIQNSPGGQSQDLSNIEIFDIGEYLPKIKTISPKTSIDYSKYKTIERPHTRHNISSRYNSDEQPNGEEVVAMRRPVIMEERESIDRPVVSEERIAHEKEHKVVNEEVATPTTQKIVQFRRGTRPNTQRTTAETAEPTESVVTRRTVNRKRPAPSGFRTTRKTTTTEVTEATEKVQRIYPQHTQNEKLSAQTYPPPKRVYRKRPVRIRHTTERLFEDEDTVDKIVRRSLDYGNDDVRSEFEEEYLGEINVPHTYENIKTDIIIDDIRENQDISTDNTAENENVPTKEKIGLINNGIQDKLAGEGNHKEIIEKEQNYGELVRQDNERTKFEKINFEREYIPETEKSKENPDSENNKNTTKKLPELQDNQEEATQNQNIKEDVEILGQVYDKEIRHGGNYKRESEDNLDDIETGRKILNNDAKLLDETNNQSDVEIINKDFDKTQRHGGNYKAQEEVPIDEVLETRTKGIELQQTESTNSLRSKKVGTNSSEGKAIKKINNIEYVGGNGQSNTSNNGINKKSTIRVKLNNASSPSSLSAKPIERLTDIVPKPDHFYTDSQLPKQVNKLETEKSGSSLDSKELDQVTKEGDVIDVEEVLRKQINNRRSYKTNRTNVPKEFGNGNDGLDDSQSDEDNNESENEDLVNNADGLEEKVIPTKKPLFIKDASKRLYFYAPV